MAIYEPGQVWTYRTRPAEPDSRLRVVKLDDHPRFGTVVHIYLEGLAMPSPMQPGATLEAIPHMPFTTEALDGSVLECVEEGAALPDFEDAYEAWAEAFRRGEGGIFRLSVAAALDYLERAIAGAGTSH